MSVCPYHVDIARSTILSSVALRRKPAGPPKLGVDESGKWRLRVTRGHHNLTSGHCCKI